MHTSVKGDHVGRFPPAPDAGGGLLFGYFRLARQEKVTLPCEAKPVGGADESVSLNATATRRVGSIKINQSSFQKELSGSFLKFIFPLRMV